MNWTASDHQYMLRALQLARNGLYGTTPNPRVGCVLVRDGQVVGEGWHERAGEAHAEVNALKAAGAAARGATAFINLEPCSHSGRTPACADALVKAGVARVVYSMIDPDPRVAGRGDSMLRAAGIATAAGLMEDSARELNAGFIQRLTHGLPRVRCKMAISLDGRVAAADGSSRWITGPEARDEVQHLRAQSCAVLTGSGTILADDPRLDVRLEGASRQPLRVVLDRRLRIPAGAAVLAPPGRCVVFSEVADRGARTALEKAGAEVVVPPAGEEDFAKRVLGYLAREEEINDVLVEAGPALAGALLAAGLVDDLIVYQAPLLLGHRGLGAVQLPGIESLGDALRLSAVDLQRVGNDWRFIFRRPVERL